MSSSSVDCEKPKGRLGLGMGLGGRISSVPYVWTSRFTWETWHETIRARQDAEKPCLYSVSVPISASVPWKAAGFVIEMNNEANLVMGIGYIMNRPMDYPMQIHSDSIYNRFTYEGDWHMGRDELMRRMPREMEILEEMLFRGKNHCKRSNGLTAIPSRFDAKRQLLPWMNECVLLSAEKKKTSNSKLF